MKKLFLASALALFGAMNAQQYGAKAGLNIANLTNVGGSSLVGFYVGGYYNAPLAAQFSIQPELLFNGKGSKYTEGGSSVSSHLSYISVPVMFQYKATPELYLEAGPEFGFLVGAKEKGSGYSMDFKSECNTFDFGLGLGAGYHFTKNIGVTARYVAGFTDILKNNPGTSIKNSVFQIGLAYKLSK